MKQGVRMEKKYGITASDLQKARAKLIASSGESLTWVDLAKRSNISKNTFCNILNGRTYGSISTARKLMDIAPKFGTVLSLGDLVSEL